LGVPNPFEETVTVPWRGGRRDGGQGQ
jgi:hypothetical protein